VLATVLGAVDLGYRVILVRDAVSSSSTPDTTRCCASITAATPSRSRPQTPRRSCSIGG